MLKTIHNFIVIFFCLLSSGCTRWREKRKKQAPTNRHILQEHLNVFKNQKNYVRSKSCVLSALWLKECSVGFSDVVDAGKLLKKVAHSLGIELSISEEIKLNYKAKNKSFVDILLDICSQLNLKLKIKGLNGYIEKDIAYLHTYDISNLTASISTEFSTSTNSAFGDDNKVNSSKSLYKVNNQFFEMLSSNLLTILDKKKFSINSDAGVLTVHGTQKDHHNVLLYLNSIKKGLNDQVLVEAKVLEIELFKDYACGVDFDKLKLSIRNAIQPINQMDYDSNITMPDPSKILKFTSKIGVSLFNLLLDHLSVYGRIRSMSNPYMLISNNHIGIFKAVENKIYFKYKTETVFSSDNKFGSKNKQAEFVTCPVGVILSVHVKKLKNGLIKLYLKPTITQVSKEIEDLGYKYMKNDDNDRPCNESISPKLPIMKVREMETVLILDNDEYAIIGGLIDNNIYQEKKWFKTLYKSRKTELIILLRVHIIKHDEEVDLYEFLVDQ